MDGPDRCERLRRRQIASFTANKQPPPSTENATPPECRPFTEGGLSALVEETAYARRLPLPPAYGRDQSCQGLCSNEQRSLAQAGKIDLPIASPMHGNARREAGGHGIVRRPARLLHLCAEPVKILEIEPAGPHRRQHLADANAHEVRRLVARIFNPWLLDGGEIATQGIRLDTKQ